jgi:hypothetical protein
VTEYLPSVHEALSSNPSTAQKMANKAKGNLRHCKRKSGQMAQKPPSFFKESFVGCKGKWKRSGWSLQERQGD